MDVSYTRPLGAAWKRMRATLFARPFPIEAWFVIGFSAWLSAIFSNTGSGLGSSWRDRDLKDLGDLGDAGRVYDWAMQPAVLTAIGVVLCLLLVVALVLSWVSARAQFVFLDNVVHGRAAFVAPWKRSGKLGRSLFLWHAAMSFAWLVPLGCAIGPMLPLAGQFMAGHDVPSPAVSASIVAGLLAALVTSVLLAAVYALNDDFVVPLMWKYDEGASAAWRRFGRLLSAHAGDFGAYLVFAFFLSVAAFIAVVLAGLLTCCVGLVLAMLPYVGVVVTLPVYFTLRALGPEFLRQFGPEWDVWAPNPASFEEQLPPLA